MAKRKDTIPSAEISSFCAEVAMMLGAGMQLYDGMEALAKTYENTPRYALYAKLSEGMQMHGSLYIALQEGTSWPSHMVEMVGIGERTGRLEDVMNGLSAYYSREDRIRSAVIGAVTYPIVLALMLVAIVLIMVATVLPVFSRMFGAIGIGESATGAVLLQVGQTIGWVVLTVVALLAAAVLTVALLMRTSKRQQVIDAVSRVFPPLRKLSDKLSASRVFSVLSMMLASAFPIDEALQMAVSVLNDQRVSQRVQEMHRKMEEGVSFSDALEDAKLLDPVHTRMVRMAVQVGREDEVMAKVAATYEEQVEEDIASLISIIEPTLVALLCLVIGGILLWVMLPMAGVISSIL